MNQSWSRFRILSHQLSVVTKQFHRHSARIVGIFPDIRHWHRTNKSPQCYGLGTFTGCHWIVFPHWPS